jgi:phosphate starvation-inducible PhoH-like protein
LNEKNIIIDELDLIDLWGVNNQNQQRIEEAFADIKIISRGNIIKLIGEKESIRKFEKSFNLILDYVKQKGKLTEQKLDELLDQKRFVIDQEEAEELSVAGQFNSGKLQAFAEDNIIVHGVNGKIVRARTENQKKLVEYIVENDIVFALGPAGTGKTYTAVALAVRALKNKEIKRIILARPAVEAGENLGFLPGDLKEKIDPYLRPLYDALDDMIPPEKLKSYVEGRIIEIAPMAFMRGRTLDNCFVILDEAQNATDMQLKMFLTRMGPNAKVIITGDLTQIDLPKKQQSGLTKAVKILSDIKGIKIAFLDVNDVVRHRLVKQIIKAYDQNPGT